MSETVAKLAARKGRVPALVAALVILGWFVLTRLIQALVNVGWQLSASASTVSSNGGGLYDLSNTYQDYWAAFANGVVSRDVPFALGVFICLWAIAPISHELGLRFVLTRGSLASLAGSLLVAIVAIFIAFFAALHFSTHPFGPSLLSGGFEGQMFLNSVIGSLIGIVTFAIMEFPLVGLVVVVLWLWLRDHPREYEISGLIDEL
jgi:hypothetical protein